MKVISWNLLHGQPLPPPQTPLSPDLATSLLQGAALRLSEVGAEVIGLQEVDDSQSRSAHISQVTTIAHALGACDWAFAPAVIGTPGESWRPLTSGDEHILIGGGGKGKSTKKQPDSDPRYGIGLVSTIPVKKWHCIELGRSRIGLPLAIPSAKGSKAGMRFIYVRDEPRVGLAAELENGFTVAVTHLSFVPFVNYFQLIKIRRWLKALPGEPVLIGDLNLGWGLPVRGTQWRSLRTMNTYPSWGAKIQFDYITAYIPKFGERLITDIEIPDLGISDHLPIGVEII